MTGDDTLHWSNDNGSWSACELNAKDNGTSAGGKPLHRAAYYPTGEKINGQAMFTLICEYVDQNCALGAGTKGKDETINNGRGSGTIHRQHTSLAHSATHTAMQCPV